MKPDDPTQPPLTVRRYGEAGSLVLLLHGGPGAGGYVAPVARRLAEQFRVWEPLQRGSSGEPLTVKKHIEDLYAVARGSDEGRPPLIVGHSWGAMLALACAAEHADCARAIVLVGCGTFDVAARRQMHEERSRRMRTDPAARAERWTETDPSTDAQLRALGRLYLKIDSVDLIPHADETVGFDHRAYYETWEDMLALQTAGVYPAALAAVRQPVLMIHGDSDPHPARATRERLAAVIPQLEYRELARCGHYPWLERAAREEFYAILFEWLGGRA